MADSTEDTTVQKNPLYDVPRKPEIAPRTKVPTSAGTGDSTSEKPLKPLVPPKRRHYTTSGIPSIKATPSSTSATPPATAVPSISVAEKLKKFEQSIQQKKESPTVTPVPVKVPPPVIPPKLPSSQQNQSKPLPSVPQTGGQQTGGQLPNSSRYVEVGSPPVEASDYAEPDTIIPGSSTSSHADPGNTDYSELMETSADDSNKLVIKSKPFGLEEFAASFPLPQIVRVYTGHYGITEQFSMSEGEELILFFIKSAKIVMASTQRRTETYHLPLNSSLQFGPYRIKSSESETHSYHYATVEDLIKRKEGLPKVVKVFKTFSGLSEQQSVMAGELIFPQKVSGKKKNQVLKCKNKHGTKLKLGLNCAGDFSTDPSDIRMYLLEYIEHINVFPVTVLIFNEKNDYNSKLSCLRTGTILILEAPSPLRSYICSTDVFGERDYPILELPMIMPIQIQCMERPGLDMQPIYSKIQHAYENFNPSMIKKSMFPAQNEKELQVQQQFYEEVKKDDGESHFYDLERPEAIYEPIPGDTFDSEIRKEVKPPRPSLPSKPISPQKPTPLIPSSVKSPPLPPMIPTSPKSTKERSLPSVKGPPLPPMNPTSPKSTGERSFPPPLPIRETNPVPSSPLAMPGKAVPVTPPLDQTQGKVTTIQSSEETTCEGNKALLKAMTVEDVLQLLDNMNLGEYKDNFQKEQVDGELMLELTKSDLEDLGVTRNIHQIRLTKLIDGSSSVKKYADGLYGTLS